MTGTIGGMSPPSRQWICCQIGAREHYAIPCALLRSNVLCRLITDSWAWRSSLLGRVANQPPARDSGSGGGVRAAANGRFHEQLSQATVAAFNASLLQFELLARVRRPRG